MSAAKDASELLTIRGVSEYLQVPTPTIRSWERRYEIPCVSRTPGGHRRYTAGEIRMLQRMRDAIADGHRAVAAAAMVKAEAGGSPQSLVQALLDATEQLEPSQVADVLDQAERLLGLSRTVDEVLLPALRLVGVWWRNGRCDIAHEHLATEAVRAWLATATANRPGPTPSRPILLACGPQDVHTVGLECLAALLSRRGCDCRMLGARTPTASLAVAVDQARPAAVIIASHLPVGRRAAVQALEVAARRCPTFYGGGAFTARRTRADTPGTYLGDSLTVAADLVVGAVYPAHPR